MIWPETPSCPTRLTKASWNGSTAIENPFWPSSGQARISAFSNGAWWAKKSYAYFYRANPRISINELSVIDRFLFHNGQGGF